MLALVRSFLVTLSASFALWVRRVMSSVVVDLTGSDDDRVDPIGREVARRKAMDAVLATAELVLPPGCKKPKARHDEVQPPLVPPTKRARAGPASAVFVLAKGDWPRSQSQKLVNVKVLGTYSSRALAEAAKAAFLHRGGWEEGYGYHQGEDAESSIEIYRSVLDAPVR